MFSLKDFKDNDYILRIRMLVNMGPSHLPESLFAELCFAP